MSKLKPVIVLMIGFINFIAQGQVTVHYNDQRATSIVITADCQAEQLMIRLQESTAGMLGSMETGTGGIIFTPLVPFTAGYTYEVICNEQVIAAFSPDPIKSEAPQVVAIFPDQDTVPENLLKMHFRFSQPMVSGNSYQHISITENGKPVTPFLELEAELWNEEYTVFTLWLDPGRIKRQLTPNQLYGNPLTKGKVYALTIYSLWKGKNGVRLQRNFNKAFYVNERDETLPDPSQWSVQASATEINIKFNEPLDYLLLQHSLNLMKNGEQVSFNTIVVSNMGIRIVPLHPLFPGDYVLKIDSKLEDLAGNNLLRPFDRDLLANPYQQTITELRIRVEGDSGIKN